jgi:hypothetical protein
MYLPFNAIYAKAAAGCQLMVLKFTRMQNYSSSNYHWHKHHTATAVEAPTYMNFGAPCNKTVYGIHLKLLSGHSNLGV